MTEPTEPQSWLRRRFPFLFRPVTLWGLLVVVVAMLVGFGIGLSVQRDTANKQAAQVTVQAVTNRRLIREIEHRQHAECVDSNQQLQVSRNIVNAAFAPGATTRVQAPPFPAHPDVQAYIQELLDGLSAQSNSSAHDRVLATIPADTDCSHVGRH